MLQVMKRFFCQIHVTPFFTDDGRDFVPDTFHNYATYCDISAAKIVVDQKDVQVKKWSKIGFMG